MSTDLVAHIDKALAEPKDAQSLLRQFLMGYLLPAFGSASKAETDILVFKCLIDAKIVDPFGPIYPISRLLNITPTKARSLVFNWQLRVMSSGNDLKELLLKALRTTRFSKDGTLLTFGIESPILKEEVVARLKEKGFFSDSSFSREIVRLPVEAFVEFLDDLIDEETKRAFKLALVKDRAVPDTSFKALATGALKKLGEKVAGEAGGAIAKGIVGKTTDFLTSLFSHDGAAAAGSVEDLNIFEA